MSGYRTSPSQFETMVEFMERNGDLNKPGDGPASRIKSIVMWEELSSALNSDITGGKKPVEKWKKVWSDFKNNTKRKALKIQASRNTSSRPTSKLALTDVEWRVLNLKKRISRLSDHINVSQSVLEISPLECSSSPMIQPIKDEPPIEIDDEESEVSNKELSPEPEIPGFNLTKHEDVNSLLAVLEKGTISDVDESDSDARVGSDNVHRNEAIMLIDCFDEEKNQVKPAAKAESSNKKPNEEDWTESAPGSSKDPLEEPQNPTKRTPRSPRILRKVMPKSIALKAFLECDRYARDSERERNRMWYEIEKERIRQRDVELQLQNQWLQFMKEALVVVKGLVDIKKIKD